MKSSFINPKNHNRQPCRLVVATVALWLLCQTITLAQTGQMIWKLGKVDNSAAEFTNYTTGNPEAVTVPSDWATRSSWSFMSKGLKATVNPAMTLNFTLGSVPANGVMFSFKLLDADRVAPEMAVFSNGVMAGLIQLYGSGNAGVPDKWKKTYQLYIPNELLQTGNNVLRLEAPRSYYASAAIDQYLYWEWDYLNLVALDAPATEPLHGKMTYMGTSVKLGSNNFSVNDNTLAIAPAKLKWMGIAYSNNTIRADFWSDISTTTQNRRLEYLHLLRDLNMTVIADHLNSAIGSLDADGNLSISNQNRLNDFFTAYGNLFQYYETDNEPGLFNRSKAVNMAIGRHVNQIKPAHVKTTAPGWAYWPTNGSPSGWERDPMHRGDVESLSQATNGHAYATSYADAQGGNITENLETYGGVVDGWPKEFVNTEMGTNNGHRDFTFAGASQPHAAISDRIVRAHVAVVDRFMQHATSFGSYSMFNQSANWTDLSLLIAHPGVTGQDTRLKTFRRLALAYSTHGAPLKYTYLNKADVTGKKVYFRGVNTATLAPSPGSGATANKLLLNFVNFETTPQTMAVQVTLPACGTVLGERIGAGDSYSVAFSNVTLTTTSTGTLSLTMTLPAGESVQYILGQSTGTCNLIVSPGNSTTNVEAILPAAPTSLTVSGVTLNSAVLNWTAPTNRTAITGYDIYYRNVLAGSVEGNATTTFSLTGLSYDSPYNYTVGARDVAYNQSVASNPVYFLTGRVPRPDLVVTNISISPGAVIAGQQVSFRATVKNQGAVPTPAGTIVGAAFRVSGSTNVLRYARRYDKAIAPNESVELIADSAGTGNTFWRPTVPGSFTLTAIADTEDRVSESEESNNSYSEVFTVNPAIVESTSLASPINLTVYKEGQPVSIWAVSTATGLDKIEFYSNGIKIGEDLTSSYSLTWTPPAVGTFGIHAKVYKGAEVVETSAVTILDLNLFDFQLVRSIGLFLLSLY